MAKVQRSAAWLRKRKMLAMLPVLIIPFLTMAFWALGGGKGEQVTSSRSQGLNLNLPNANLKEDKVMDKLSFYDLAAKDSSKLAEQIRNDPYYQKERDNLFAASPVNLMAEQAATKYHQPLNTSPFQSNGRKPEDEIMKKVALLQEQLNKGESLNKDTDRLRTPNSQEDPSLSNNMDRLENMMQSMNETTDDPQMKQMDDMLSKILDIQHPERVKERIKERSVKEKDKVFSVSKMPSVTTISLLDTEKHSSNDNSFFGIEDNTAQEQNAIEAVIHQAQTLVSGAVIKLRLLDDLYIAGDLIPKESFVYGICALNGERLEVEISSIRNNNSLFPVKLQVFDMDGLPGVYIPGAITRDVAKQSADNSLQLMELSTMDPSLKAQATASGINAVKDLLSKKTKLVKVTVKAGYKVLLKQEEGSM